MSSRTLVSKGWRKQSTGVCTLKPAATTGLPAKGTGPEVEELPEAGGGADEELGVDEEELPEAGGGADEELGVDEEELPEAGGGAVEELGADEEELPQEGAV